MLYRMIFLFHSMLLLSCNQPNKHPLQTVLTTKKDYVLLLAQVMKRKRVAPFLYGVK